VFRSGCATIAGRSIFISAPAIRTPITTTLMSGALHAVAWAAPEVDDRESGPHPPPTGWYDTGETFGRDPDRRPPIERPHMLRRPPRLPSEIAVSHPCIGDHRGEADWQVARRMPNTESCDFAEVDDEAILVGWAARPSVDGVASPTFTSWGSLTSISRP
jgi:hypothetical protein